MELAGKVSTRVINALRRACLGGQLTKPIKECTDEDLLFIRGIGKKSLAEIRQALGKNAGLASPRPSEVIRLRKAGLSYAQIGCRLGISKERVRQILKGKRAEPGQRQQKPGLDSKVMLTTSDVAKLLGLHPNTVRRWDAEGILKAYRIGPRGDRRFKREDVDNLLKGASEE